MFGEHREYRLSAFWPAYAIGRYLDSLRQKKTRRLVKDALAEQTSEVKRSRVWEPSGSWEQSHPLGIRPSTPLILNEVVHVPRNDI